MIECHCVWCLDYVCYFSKCFRNLPVLHKCWHHVLIPCVIMTKGIRTDVHDQHIIHGFFFVDCNSTYSRYLCWNLVFSFSFFFRFGRSVPYSTTPEIFQSLRSKISHLHPKPDLAVAVHVAKNLVKGSYCYWFGSFPLNVITSPDVQQSMKWFLWWPPSHAPHSLLSPFFILKK